MRAYRYALSLGLVALGFAACAQAANRNRGDDDDDGGAGSMAGCGDGLLDEDEGEECDGADLDGMTCESLGMPAGELACDASCTIDTSACGNVCGDGVREGDEDCDGTDLGGMDCASVGMGSGTLTCDTSCAYTGCSTSFGENFESGTLGTWSVTGTPPWAPTATQPHGGTYAAQNGDIGASQQTGIQKSLTFSAAGNVTFWHRESTESCCDHLKVYVDGLEQGSYSGENAWTSATIPVTAGTHTLEFRYIKDSSVDTGLDTVWVDDIVSTNGS